MSNFDVILSRRHFLLILTMNLLKNIRLKFFLCVCQHLSILLLILMHYSYAFNECFEDYHFKCENPNDFLLQLGINVENNILDPKNLQVLQQKFNGGCTGGVYQDEVTRNIYFIKQSHVFSEFIGSKLMHLIMGQGRTPVTKIVKDYLGSVASLKLKNFKTRKELASKKRFKKKTIIGEAELAVYQDFLGLVDRHPGNMGFQRHKKGKKLLAARADMDSSFAFEVRPKANGQYKPGGNHLNLNQLYLSMHVYPEHDVMKAIKTVIDIPDEKIIMTLFEAWVTFSRTGYNEVSLDSCMSLARKLNERKKAFKTIYENPNSVNYLSLKEDPAFKKVFKELKKQKRKNLKQKFKL